MAIEPFDEHAKEQPDELLATHLRALHELPNEIDVERLRRRIVDAATPLLASRSRQTMRVVTRPSWLDVTVGFGRVVVPLSVAAALFAAVVLRKLPQTTATNDPTIALAYELTYSVSSESNGSPSIAEQLLMPESADDVLLAPLGARVDP